MGTRLSSSSVGAPVSPVTPGTCSKSGWPRVISCADDSLRGVGTRSSSRFPQEARAAVQAHRVRRAQRPLDLRPQRVQEGEHIGVRQARPAGDSPAQLLRVQLRSLHPLHLPELGRIRIAHLAATLYAVPENGHYRTSVDAPDNLQSDLCNLQSSVPYPLPRLRVVEVRVALLVVAGAAHWDGHPGLGELAVDWAACGVKRPVSVATDTLNPALASR